MRGIRPSYALLRDQGAIPERLLNSIYLTIPAGNGSMATHRNRLDELDRLIVAEIDRRFSNGQPVRVHDMAASNAITSVHLFRKIAEIRPVEFTASDYFDALYCVRMWGLDFFFDAVDKPAQLGFGQRGMSLRRGPWKFVTAPLWPLAKRHLGRAIRIPLFHHEAQRLAAETDNFKLAQVDIFAPPPSPRYDVVRLVNVTSASLATLDQRVALLRRIASTVDDGGLIIFGNNNYQIFLCRKDELVQIATLGDGAYLPTDRLTRSSNAAPSTPTPR